jgi:hypothetical protein
MARSDLLYASQDAWQRHAEGMLVTTANLPVNGGAAPPYGRSAAITRTLLASAKKVCALISYVLVNAPMQFRIKTRFSTVGRACKLCNELARLDGTDQERVHVPRPCKAGNA